MVMVAASWPALPPYGLSSSSSLENWASSLRDTSLILADLEAKGAKGALPFPAGEP